MYGVRADPLLRILEGGQLGEESYRALGRLVLRAAVSHPHEAELRRDIDDGAAAGLPQSGNDGLAPEEYAFGVHLHHAVPGLDGRILEAARPADARIVDEDVQHAEAPQGEVDGLFPVGLARHVEPREDRRTALGAHVGLHRVAFGFENIADHHARPFAGEETRLRRSHPERSSADQRHLALEPHLASPPAHAHPSACMKRTSVLFAR